MTSGTRTYRPSPDIRTAYQPSVPVRPPFLRRRHPSNERNHPPANFIIASYAVTWSTASHEVAAPSNGTFIWSGSAK
jgi:hypothetical protein